MNTFFWILWVVELGFAGWWVVTEMQLTYLKPNPLALLSLLYLLVVLMVRFGLGFTKTSMAMVIVPGLPLFLMFLVAALATLTGTRWN